MIPLIRNFFHALFFDEQAARRWLAGLAGLLISSAATVGAFGIDVVLGWSRREWIAHSLVVLIGGLLTMITPTPKPSAPPTP